MSNKLGQKARRRLGQVIDLAKAETRGTDESPSVTVNALRSYIEKLHSQLRIANSAANRQADLAERHSWDVERYAVKLDRATKRAKESLWIGGVFGLIAGMMLGASVFRALV